MVRALWHPEGRKEWVGSLEPTRSGQPKHWPMDFMTTGGLHSLPFPVRCCFRHLRVHQRTRNRREPNCCGRKGLRPPLD